MNGEAMENKSAEATITTLEPNRDVREFELIDIVMLLLPKSLVCCATCERSTNRFEASWVGRTGMKSNARLLQWARRVA
jgi:hypothetical protein